MQVVRDLDAESICERLLNLEPEIMYSSYLDAGGSITGEATRNSMIDYGRLTIMVLPLHPSKESLVLATPIDCNLNEIVTTTKRLLL